MLKDTGVITRDAVLYSPVVAQVYFGENILRRIYSAQTDGLYQWNFQFSCLVAFAYAQTNAPRLGVEQVLVLGDVGFSPTEPASRRSWRAPLRPPAAARRPRPAARHPWSRFLGRGTGALLEAPWRPLPLGGA